MLTLFSYVVIVRGPTTSYEFLGNYINQELASHSILQPATTTTTLTTTDSLNYQQQQQPIRIQGTSQSQPLMNSSDKALPDKATPRDVSNKSLRDKNYSSTTTTKTLNRLRRKQQYNSTTMSTTNATNNSRKPNKSMKKEPIKILLFLTTIFSEYHIQMFHCCWPKLLHQSKLLSKVHIAIFSNNETQIPAKEMEYTQQLFATNPTFTYLFPNASDLDTIASTRGSKIQFQVGANLGPKLAFQHNNSWFTKYDWIIRINPDVFIRQSDWLYRTMNDPQVDAIVVYCEPGKIHTDFFAVRPNVLKHHWPDIEDSPFSHMQLNPQSKRRPNRTVWVNHETTAQYYFQPIMNQQRHAYLPNHDKSSGICRVRGQQSPIVHDHTYCQNDTNICEALEGWDIT